MKRMQYKKRVAGRGACFAAACLVLLGGCQQADAPPAAPAPSARLSGLSSDGASGSNRAAAAAIDDLASSLAEMSSSLAELSSSLAEMSSSLAAVFSSSEAAAAAQAARSGAAAGSSSEDTSSRPEGGSSSSQPGDSPAPAVPDVKARLSDARAVNKDSVAWIQVPNTAINEVVVQGTDNKSYSRRNAKGELVSERAQTNAAILDFECDLGSGSAADVPQNTVVYGVNFGTWSQAAKDSGWAAYYDAHYRDGELVYDTTAEEQEGDRLSEECERLARDNPDGAKFSQLLRFTQAEFARKTPYIYLTTPGGDLIYEVFSVGYTNAYTEPPYNLAAYSGDKLVELSRQMREKSLFNYDVGVSEDDRILTLSTDTFKYGGKKDVYGNRAKFVVMARLMQPGDTYHEAAILSENKSPAEPSVE